MYSGRVIEAWTPMVSARFRPLRLGMSTSLVTAFPAPFWNFGANQSFLDFLYMWPLTYESSCFVFYCRVSWQRLLAWTQEPNFLDSHLTCYVSVVLGRSFIIYHFSASLSSSVKWEEKIKYTHTCLKAWACVPVCTHVLTHTQYSITYNKHYFRCRYRRDRDSMPWVSEGFLFVCFSSDFPVT